MFRMLVLALTLALISCPRITFAQTWDRVGGSMSTSGSTTTPVVIINQNGSGNILSLRASGVDVWTVSSTGITTSLASAVTSAFTVTRAGIGVTSTDGLVLNNTTAAAAGAQQMSPRIRFDGFGWKTDATAESQSVSVINELLPVQGTSNPTANLLWKFSVNGGAYSTILTLGAGGALTVPGALTTTGVNGAIVASSTISAAQGTTAFAPLKLTAGGPLTVPEIGAVEMDSASFYKTQDTTNGRTAIDGWNYFRLTGSGTGITTIADFFGATGSGIPLVASGVYEIEWYAQFSQATAGIATWTIVTATTALASLTGEYTCSNIAGIGAVAAPQRAGINVTTSSSTAFPVTGTMANAVTHQCNIRVMLQAGAGASNTRLRLTMSAGTATPLINSYFRVRRLPAANTGTFVS